MAVSNATGAIVLTTGNKSEMATGYSTLYGDSAGGFAVIKDVPKTLVYELCRYRNEVAVEVGDPEPIPLAVLDEGAVGRTATRPARRPVAAPLRRARPVARALRRRRRHRRGDDRERSRPRAGPADHAPRGPAASTSGARCRRAFGSRRRPSAVTVVCRSRTPFARASMSRRPRHRRAPAACFDAAVPRAGRDARRS